LSPAVTTYLLSYTNISDETTSKIYEFVGNFYICGISLSILVIDEKYRVLLDKKLRKKMGLKKGDALLAIPYRGGILLTSVKGKGFVGSLNNFK